MKMKMKLQKEGNMLVQELKVLRAETQEAYWKAENAVTLVPGVAEYFSDGYAKLHCILVPLVSRLDDLDQHHISNSLRVVMEEEGRLIEQAKKKQKIVSCLYRAETCIDSITERITGTLDYWDLHSVIQAINELKELLPGGYLPEEVKNKIEKWLARVEKKLPQTE